MRLYLALALGGLPLGAMYALQALGIVVIYKTSRVFTFATGAIGMTAAYLASWLNRDQHVPIGLAVLAATLAGVGLGVVMEAFTIRPVRGAINRTVVTLGWLIGLQGLVGVLFGNTAGRRPAQVFPNTEALRINAIHLIYGVDYVSVLLVALALAVGLGAFFRRSALGTSMRAVADEPEVAGLLGLATSRVTMTAWGLGCGISALAGVLITPLLASLDTITLIIFTIQALAAALVGRLSSLPLTFVGGLLLGMAQPVIKHALAPLGLQGTEELVALAVILVALVFRRRSGRPDIGGGLVAPAAAPSVLTGRVLAATLGGAALVGVLAPVFGGPTAHVNVSLVLIWSLAVLSLVFLTGVVGQVSVCQAVFMGVGAFGAGIAVKHGLPFLLAIVIGGLLAALTATLVGLPAIRLAPLELAIATVSLAFTADRFLYQWPPLVSRASSRPLPRPSWASIGPGHLAAGQRAYAWLLVVLFTLGAIAVVNVRRGRTGAALTALRSSEAATSAMGFSVTSVKLRGFAFSGFLAGIAGAAFAGLNEVATGNAFDTTRSISLLAYAVIAGIGSVPGALVGGIIVTLSTVSVSAGSGLQNGRSASLITALTGVLLIVVLRFAPQGLTGLGTSALRRLLPEPRPRSAPPLAEVVG